MTPVLAALAPYGADLDPNGFIRKGGRVLGVRAVVQGKRLRMEGRDGGLLFSGGVTSAAVDAFVFKFWGWRVPVS